MIQKENTMSTNIKIRKFNFRFLNWKLLWYLPLINFKLRDPFSTSQDFIDTYLR